MTTVQRILQGLKSRGFTVTGDSEADGIIVALAIPRAMTDRLSVPGGEEPGEMHVTLAYLGKSSELTEADMPRYLALATQLQHLAAGHAQVLLVADKHHVFPGADDGMDACVVDVSAPNLLALREQIMDLCDACGTPGSRKFPTFHAHVTLAYVYPDELHPEPNLPEDSYAIPDVQLWLGGRHVAFPFRATMSKADEEPPTAGPGTSAARSMLAHLTGDLIGLHRSERQARRQTDAVRAHHGARVDALAGVVRAPRGSAVEDALLEHAQEAHTARTLTDL